MTEPRDALKALEEWLIKNPYNRNVSIWFRDAVPIGYVVQMNEISSAESTQAPTLSEAILSALDKARAG